MTMSKTFYAVFFPVAVLAVTILLALPGIGGH